MRRLTWVAAFVLGLLALAGAAWSAFGPEKIVLTEPQLQERINRQLPREFRGVTVERATLSLADGRVSFHVEARATALGQAVVAAAFARGVPRYNPEGGEIFFDAEDVRLENFKVGTGNLAERAERLGARLGGRVGEAVEQNLPRVESAASALIAAGVKAYLAARPVYRFKDDVKGVVLKATIGDIAIAGETLVIDLSPIKLTATVAFWLLGLVLVLFVVAWLVRRPRWGAKADPVRR